MKWKQSLCALSLSSLLLLSAVGFAEETEEVINWQLEALETNLKLDQATIELQQCREENEIVKFWLNRRNQQSIQQYTKQSKDVLNEYKKSLEPPEETNEEEPKP